MKRYAAILVVLLAAACSARENGSGSGGSRDHRNVDPSSATIVGTTLDAATGEPLEGVEVTAPGGAHATSGPDGRFSIPGLAIGTEGTLTARASDGRKAENRLRPLRAGELEVVLRLR